MKRTMGDTAQDDAITGVQSLVLGGLPVRVYGLRALASTSASSSAPSTSTSGASTSTSSARPTTKAAAARKRVHVLFFLHGRMQDSNDAALLRTVRALLMRQREHEVDDELDSLLVVTFDHRNHGVRTVDRRQNRGWKDSAKASEKLDNAQHALDMYAIQLGSARDISFLIDVLPPALFPYDEHSVWSWSVAGISLGGHSTWLALANDPRLGAGISIVGAPDYLSLLSHRARSLPSHLQPLVSQPSPGAGDAAAQTSDELELTAPAVPASLVALAKANDAAHKRPLSAWAKGKKLLVLAGEQDTLVPHVQGGAASLSDELQSVDECHVEIFVQPETGHMMTDEMTSRMVDFVFRHVVGSASPGSTAASGRL